jgi:two-component system response regulator BaeR
MLMPIERKIILSVEDNEDIASLIRLVLRHAPVELIHVLSADEANKILQTTQPDLLLLDMMLPGMTGLDFLTQLRKDTRFTKLPVIVITVRAEVAFRQRAQELGVNRYLLKPFSPTTLRQEIQHTLGVKWKDTGTLTPPAPPP